MSDNYNVVFSGRLVDGFTLGQARSNLSTMLGIADPAVLDRVFSGQRVLLKKGLSAADAQKHRTALSAAGVACEVVPQAAATVQGEARSSSPPAVGDAAAPAVAPRPAIARMEERGEPVKRFASHHQQAREQMAAERTNAGDPVTRVTQDAAVAGLDPRFAPWDPHFFPDCARGLSWGGFFAPLLWGSFNGLALSFVPALGVRFLRHIVPSWAWILLYLAFGTYYLVYGREMAWEHKSWRNADHFIRIQRYWAYGGAAFFVLVMYGLGLMVVHDRQAAKLLAAENQYQAAIVEAVHINDLNERNAAKGKARQALLDVVSDAGQRATFQQQFRDEDEAEREQQEDSKLKAQDAAGSDAGDGGSTPDSDSGSDADSGGE